MATTKNRKPTLDTTTPVAQAPVETPNIDYDGQPLDDATSELKAEQASKQPTQQEQRAKLLAAGYKRCPQHSKLLDRLPEEFRTPVNGYQDVSIRPLSEFQKNTGWCRNCDHLIQRDWRASHKQPATAQSKDKLQALHDKLLGQYNALAARLQDLEQQLKEAE